MDRTAVLWGAGAQVVAGLVVAALAGLATALVVQGAVGGWVAGWLADHPFAEHRDGLVAAAAGGAVWVAAVLVLNLAAGPALPAAVSVDLAAVASAGHVALLVGLVGLHAASGTAGGALAAWVRLAVGP